MVWRNKAIVQAYIYAYICQDAYIRKCQLDVRNNYTSTLMASLHPISVSPEESQELDTATVQEGIQNIIQNLTLAPSQELTSFSNLEFDKTIHEFLKKLNDMIFKLEQISSILTEFLNANYSFERLVASNKDSAQETLDQVQECIKIAESYIPKIRTIRGNSEKVYIILIQFVLEE